MHRTVTSTICGDSLSDIHVSYGAALLNYGNCTLGSDTAYSSSTGNADFESGSYLIFDQVSSLSLPLYMGGFSVPSDLRVEVISTDRTVPLDVVLLKYVMTGSCVSAFSDTTIDGCPTAAACVVVGANDSTNNSLCVVTYSQAYASPSPSPNPSPASPSPEDPSESNAAMLALLGLLLVPLIAVVVACKCIRMRTRHRRNSGSATPFDPSMQSSDPWTEAVGNHNTESPDPWDTVAKEMERGIPEILEVSKTAEIPEVSKTEENLEVFKPLESGGTLGPEKCAAAEPDEVEEKGSSCV